jgi:hypothetical protein
MITTRQRFMIRLVLGVALGVAAVPAQASVILDTGPITFSADGTQFGRLTRDGVPSDWAQQKAFPGVTGAPAARSYDLFTIDSDVFPFLQISLDDPGARLFVSAYLGAFAPVNTAPNYGLNTNYLGDAGLTQPFGNPSFFQIAVAPHTQIVIPIVEVNPGGGTGASFTLIVEGFLDTDFNDIPDYQPPSAVPEPTTSALFGSGLALVALARKAQRMRSGRRT